MDRDIRSAIKARREAVSGREASPSPTAPMKSAPLFDELTAKIDAPADAPASRKKMPTPLRNAIAAKIPSSTKMKSPGKPRAATPAASGGGLLAELQRKLSKPELQSHAAAAEATVQDSQSPMEAAAATAAPKVLLPTPLREAIKQRRPTSSGKKSAKPAQLEEAVVQPAQPAAVPMALPTPVRKAIAERRASGVGAGLLSASPAPALRRSSVGGMASIKKSLRVSFDPQQNAGVQPERRERYAMPTPMRAKVSLHTSPDKSSPLPLGTAMALDAAAEPEVEEEEPEPEEAAEEEEAAAEEEAAPKDRRSSKGAKKARFSTADEPSSTKKPVRPSTAQTPCAAEAKRRASKTPKTKKERTPGTVKGAQVPAEAAQHSVSIMREWVSMSGCTPHAAPAASTLFEGQFTPVSAVEGAQPESLGLYRVRASRSPRSVGCSTAGSARTEDDGEDNEVVFMSPMPAGGRVNTHLRFDDEGNYSRQG